MRDILSAVKTGLLFGILVVISTQVFELQTAYREGTLCAVSGVKR